MKLPGWVNDPVFLEKFHGYMVLFWILLWIVAAIAGWLASVIFVSHLSAAALVLGSLSSWQSARVEVKEDQREN
jgi:hypothetical protein